MDRPNTGVNLPKKFSVPMGGTIELTKDEQDEQDKLKADREAETERIRKETQEGLQRIQSQKKTKKLIPYGTRLLVQKRKLEQTSSTIYLPDEVREHITDIADVIAVAEQTFVDQRLIANAQVIIDGLTQKACQGDAEAVNSLLKFKEYLQIMSVKAGDVLLLARYGGTDFLIPETNKYLCVCEATGIYALVVEKDAKNGA